jgi:hypothetical protein
VARLQERLEVMRPILKLILKRKEILKERMDVRGQPHPHGCSIDAT